MNGMVKLGKWRCYLCVSALNYQIGQLRRINDNAHKRIGADRTEGFIALLSGST